MEDSIFKILVLIYFIYSLASVIIRGESIYDDNWNQLNSSTSKRRTSMASDDMAKILVPLVFIVDYFTLMIQIPFAAIVHYDPNFKENKKLVDAAKVTINISTLTFPIRFIGNLMTITLVRTRMELMLTIAMLGIPISIAMNFIFICIIEHGAGV